MEVPLTTTVLVLTLWLITLPNSSCSARRVVPDDFDLFDYGAVHHNTQTNDEGGLPKGWETELTTRDSFNRVNAQTEEYDPQAFLEAWEAKTNTFNVVDYGAVGNGLVDDTKAFVKAWGAMCASSTQGTLTLLVPKGKRFLLNAVAFEGPCRASKVNFQIQGSIVAPNNIGSWTNKEMWIHFSNVQGLSVNGGGRIDGNGAVWWKACGSNKGCQRPTALHFNECHGFQLSRLALFNSPKNHISICSCNDSRVFGLLIWAPKDSPNTDGIDISRSTRVAIQSSHIATGDDCIAINSGSSYIKIRDIKCGPGHGISIGSLGQHGEYSQVEEVQVSNCSFKGTINGVRIKTWEVIGQVSDVTYRNINGTCADEKAITLACAGGGCTNIVIDNVSIKSDLPNKRSYAYCDNAHGTSSFSLPPVPCLSH
ncbi:putative polygalacturonase [Prunus yedoensis var. nudiflora]|uniref:Putative polygalacturonase n=1 Tax=Prunus yedoensis var. nudiflora TaxID=2094558 RepID=A0A314Z1B2_PRUYE|nr:putative polygalacturonase [Prunus yedoensis var. nudiflora]